MATLTCGPTGSTVQEVVVQINANTLALDTKYDEVPSGVDGNLVAFGANNTLADSQISVAGNLLTGEPIA